MKLLRSVSPFPSDPFSPEEGGIAPYTFKVTGIRVFSYEEALYHCRVYWRQSAEDVVSEEFARWVDSLGLTEAAERVRKLPKDGFAATLAAFLRTADYLEDDVVYRAEQEAKAWEKRREWEKLKENGDYLINNGEYEKAAAAYRKALAYNPESAAVFNNLAIALMKLGRYTDATTYLTEALTIEGDNVALKLNLAECLLLGGEYERAGEILSAIETGDDKVKGDVQCFLGEIEFYRGNYPQAAALFETALTYGVEPHYVYCLAEACVKARQYEKAIEVMLKVTKRDKLYLKKLADIYVAYNNIPAAVRCIEKALYENKGEDRGSVDLWTRLAALHRANYELDRAYAAAATALSLSKRNKRANLEMARIKKAQGRLKEYQSMLGGVLDDVKNEYREGVITC